jgi:hypothetical protein
MQQAAAAIKNTINHGTAMAELLPMREIRRRQVNKILELLALLMKGEVEGAADELEEGKAREASLADPREQRASSASGLGDTCARTRDWQCQPVKMCRRFR